MEAQQIGELIHKTTALVATEPKALKSGELAKLELALRAPLICESSLESITQVLRLVMMKIGIRAANLPSPEETQVLFAHIIENFGGHRIAEIKLAFDMAIGGNLDLEPKEIPCYENFSCAYFSKIMTAYRKWSADAARQVITETPAKQVIYTDQQLEDQQRGDIEAFYQRLRKGQIPYRIPEYFKGILVKDGLMTEAQEMAAFFSEKLGKGIEKLYEPK